MNSRSHQEGKSQRRKHPTLIGPGVGIDQLALQSYGWPQWLITMNFLNNWSTSELNTLLDPTTYLDYTDCWIQLVTAPTMAVTSWIQLSTCILPSTCTGGPCPPCPIRI